MLLRVINRVNADRLWQIICNPLQIPYLCVNKAFSDIRFSMIRRIKKIAVLGCLSLFVMANVEAQNNAIIKRKTGHEEPYYKNKWYFGISLATTYSGFVRYGIIKVPETGPIDVAWFTKEMFVRQLSGVFPSKANPEKINYMEKNLIKWDVFDQLWKVRYSEYPYQTQATAEPGWAGKDACPSDAQWNFLKQNYGFGSLTDYIFGDNLWKFLKDVQDPAWQAQYSSLK